MTRGYVVAHCQICAWTITGIAVSDVNHAYRWHYRAEHDTRTDPDQRLTYAGVRIEQGLYDQEDDQ